MGTGKKIALGIIIGLGAIFALIFGIYIYASSVQHADCVEWRERIKDREFEIESNLLSSLNPNLKETLNEEIRQFNSQCS